MKFTRATSGPRKGSMIFLVTTMVPVVILFSGCSSDASAPHTGASSSTATSAFPQRVGAGHLLLFRRATGRLVDYDVEKRAVVAETTRPQTFQYPFAIDDDYFTSGDSKDLGFTIERRNGPVVSRVLAASGRQGVFPVATDGKRRVFSVVDYTESGAIAGQHLALLTGGRLVNYHAVSGAVRSGVIDGDRLYFTRVSVKKSELFELLSLPVDAVSATPRSERDGLRSGLVQLIRGDLVVDGAWRGKTLKAGCEYSCQVDDRHGLLYNLHPSQDQDLTLEAIDVNSGQTKEIATGDIIDYAVTDGGATVYMSGKIVKWAAGSGA